MKVIVVKDYNKMSELAADMLASAIKEKPNCNLGLITGETPIGMYKRLVEKHDAGELDFSKVHTVNLDEYYPLSPDNDQSYRYFMNQNLFDHINIDKSNTAVPDGTAQNIGESCRQYEKGIDMLGGVDIQVLGIGRNGHIGFNEPDSELVRHTHLVELTPDTIKANSRFFESEADVPRHAITMGIQSIMKAKKIILLASGTNKAAAIKAMLCGNITTACPATLLCLHHDVTVICDEDAYSMV